jgi:hypothetical protein
LGVEGSRNTSLESDIGPLDYPLSLSGSSNGSSLPPQVNETWLAAIHGYQAAQRGMYDALRNHILAVFQEYQPYSSETQARAFLADKEMRKRVIAHLREISIHKMRSEKLLFWEQFRIRSLNFHTLSQDILAIEQLFAVADPDIATGNKPTREYVMSKDGDTILEFRNATSPEHPIVRFRVSSHLLAAASPLFTHIFSSSQQEKGTQVDMIDDLPSPPTKHICDDKMEVNVYRMPQLELNNNEALTILLDAAHMNKHKVPKEIDFPTFVSVAEVCLRYRCLPVQIELQVEYKWLPQWIHMASDDSSGRDGLLLISYVFGCRGIFARMSKSAILNATDEAEIDSKIIWPQTIRERIKAIRATKIAQIQTCCTNAVGEYFRPPQDSTDRPTSVGSLALTMVPRCPRRSHLCDATSLGWLMLVYSELRILPTIMSSAGFHDLPEPPRRSLKELLDCLRLMPSTPEVHSGVCDYAPAFRSAINDIYNSVSGLILEEVGSVLLSQGGADSTKDVDPAPFPDLHELDTVTKETSKSTPMSSNEAVCLRILSHLDDIDDLNSAAVIDKGFYAVYKNNEAALLRNVMRAERKRTMSMVSSDISGIRDSLRSYSGPKERSLPESRNEPKSLVSDNMLSARQNDLYNASPPLLPTNLVNVPMSHAEAEQILWPHDGTNNINTNGLHSKGNLIESNEKYLLGDVAHIEDKTRLGEGYKQLRDEKDQALGFGIYKSNSRS